MYQYALAEPNDATYNNVDVFRETTRINDNANYIVKTNSKIKFPSCLIQEGFSGLIQFRNIPELFKIVESSPDSKYSVKKGVCYCSICESLKSANGGDYKKHLKTHKKNECNEEDTFKNIMKWAIRYSIPFSSLDDPDFKKLHNGFISKPTQWIIVNRHLNETKDKMRYIISNALHIELSSDGWSCSLGRFQGIIAHIRYPKSYTLKLAFEYSSSPAMGSEAISKQINGVISEYNIPKEKIIGFVSDTCNEMASLSRILGLQWDKCALHIMSLIVGKFIESLPEEINHIHCIASSLARKATFSEYVAINHDKFPDIGKARNIQLGVETRWGSYAKEWKSILRFTDLINKYCEDNNVDLGIDEYHHTLLQDLVVAFDDIDTKINEMESDDFNDSLGKVATYFADIQEKCEIFINNNPSSPLANSFKLLSDLINEYYFNSSDENAKRVLMASLLNTDQNIPKKIIEMKDQIMRYIEEECIKMGLCNPFIIPGGTTIDRSPIDAFFYLRSASKLERPIEFWSNTKYFSYSLRTFAQVLFSHIPTSIENERWFSQVSDIFSKKRRNLTSEHLAILAIIKGNIDIDNY